MDANPIFDFKASTPPRQDRAASTLGDAFQTMLRETNAPAYDDVEPRRDRPAPPGADRRAPTAADEPRPRERTPRADNVTPEARRNREFDPEADNGDVAAVPQAPRETRSHEARESNGAATVPRGAPTQDAARETAPSTAAATTPSASPAGQAAGVIFSAAPPLPARESAPAQAQVPTSGPADAAAASEARGARTDAAARAVVTGPSPAVTTNGVQTGASGVMAQGLAQAPSGRPTGPQTSTEGPTATSGAAIPASGNAVTGETALAATAATGTTPGRTGAPASAPAATPHASPSPTQAGSLVEGKSADGQSTATTPQGPTSSATPTGTATVLSGSQAADRGPSSPQPGTSDVSGGTTPAANQRPTGEAPTEPDGQPAPSLHGEKKPTAVAAPADGRLGADAAGDGGGRDKVQATSTPTLAQAVMDRVRGGDAPSAGTQGAHNQSGIEGRTHIGNAAKVGNPGASDVVTTAPTAATAPTVGGTDAASPLPAASGDTATAIGGATATRAVAASGPVDRPSVNQPVPVDQVAVHIRRAAAAGEDNIRIRLHPAELGSIDVQLKVGTDGVVRAVVSIDRPETFDLMQRDARGLERALQDAGLKTDSGSLSFNLRGDGQGGAQGERQAQSTVNAQNQTAATPADETEPHPADQAAATGVGAGHLDIRV